MLPDTAHYTSSFTVLNCPIFPHKGRQKLWRFRNIIPFGNWSEEWGHFGPLLLIRAPDIKNIFYAHHCQSYPTYTGLNGRIIHILIWNIDYSWRHYYVGIKICNFNIPFQSRYNTAYDVHCAATLAIVQLLQYEYKVTQGTIELNENVD